MLELLIRQKEGVVPHLQALSHFGVSGAWFNCMVNGLCQDIPLASSEEFASLLADETILCIQVAKLHQEVSSLSKCLELVNSELAAKRVELE